MLHTVKEKYRTYEKIEQKRFLQNRTIQFWSMTHFKLTFEHLGVQIHSFVHDYAIVSAPFFKNTFLFH